MKYLLTITGPSLTGKTTAAQLLQDHGFAELVSTTTRPPRAGEVNGVHYHFVDVPYFKKMAESKQLIESIEKDGKYYGASKQALLNVWDSGKNCVVVVEPSGAKQIRKYCQENNIPVFSVFLNNPTKILLERFLLRYKNDKLAKEETYADRILSMLYEEPEKWIRPALEGNDYYDAVMPAFSKENEKEVISQIVKLANKKINNKPSP